MNPYFQNKRKKFKNSGIFTKGNGLNVNIFSSSQPYMRVFSHMAVNKKINGKKPKSFFSETFVIYLTAGLQNNYKFPLLALCLVQNFYEDNVLLWPFVMCKKCTKNTGIVFETLFNFAYQFLLL